MDAKDLNDLKQGLYEAYSEVFSNEVYYSDLLPENIGANIYNEVRHKTYGTPIQLTAKVDLNPEAEEVSIIGQKNFVNATMEVPLYCLEQTGLSTKSLVDLKKGKITFQGIDYDVVNVTPKSNVGEIFLSYTFECSGVDK